MTFKILLEFQKPCNATPSTKPHPLFTSRLDAEVCKVECHLPWIRAVNGSGPDFCLPTSSCPLAQLQIAPKACSTQHPSPPMDLGSHQPSNPGFSFDKSCTS
ncbi:Galactose-1-Phosphate Uridylyltransferase [Manis pentadactyla]|nr:Galactose-1-Phosphate Uridylyltransferase [Manis pentadactyla]